MDTQQDSQHDVSQYPDPEQSGLSFPWLDQYRPVAAENLSRRLYAIAHEDSTQEDDESIRTSRSGVRNRERSGFSEDDLLRPSTVVEDSEEDPEYAESDVEDE